MPDVIKFRKLSDTKINPITHFNKESLNEFNVVAIHQMKKKINDSVQPTGFYILTFDACAPKGGLCRMDAL